MMGYQEPSQEHLFIYGINLENRVRKDHPLRRVKEYIDFDFIYREVEDTYGTNGNVSVPPPVILKLMVLLMLYNVRSERELMETVPERLDWLWFLGYTLTSSVPDHSVLSKARKRWGMGAFKKLFERIVTQCVKAGLVDGTKIFMDSSLIDADASNNSVVDTHSLKRYLNQGYLELEKRLEADKTAPAADSPDASAGTPSKNTGGVNTRYTSTTDPDASIVRHMGDKAKLRYKTHRTVDPLHEVITAVDLTTGSVNEGYKMASLIEAHEANTATKASTVVADSQYGTGENLLICHDKGIKPHMPVVKHLNQQTSSRKGIFPEERFTYDKETDTYVCPAGRILKKRTLHENKHNIEYGALRRDCRSCPLRPECTRSKGSRTVQRPVRKEELDHMIKEATSLPSKRDLKTRQHLMERSFARSTLFGFDRARWRGLWKVAIQEYLVCAIQNIQTLIRYRREPTKGVVVVPTISIKVIVSLLSAYLKAAPDTFMLRMERPGKQRYVR
jgi:transposase